MSHSKLTNFLHDDRGNISIMFAILLVLLLLIMGTAINTSQLHAKREKLNNAADASVLAAVKAVTDEIEVIEDKEWEKAGQDAGSSVFDENIANLKGIGEVSYAFDFTVGENNRDVTGKLTYSTQAETFLSAIMGRKTVTVSNQAEATKSLFKFARINFLIDVSSSMGIGADFENQDLLFKLNGCAIACHGNDSQPNTLKLAREKGIKLRIDTVKSALAQLVNILKQSGAKNEFEVGLYTFSNSVEEHLTPTTNLNSVLNSIEDIEITNNPFQGGTNIQHSLNQMELKLPTGGDGKNAKNRESFIIILTDGVENSVRTFIDSVGVADDIDPNFKTYEPSEAHDIQIIQGFNPYNCANIKYKNHTLAFINPEYLIPKNNIVIAEGARAKFEFIEKILISEISENSKFCSSSPNFAFSAKSNEDVEQAAVDLFNDLLGESVRLSE